MKRAAAGELFQRVPRLALPIRSLRHCAGDVLLCRLGPEIFQAQHQRARRAGSQVALSYRRSSFDERSVKHWILPDLLAQIELGNIDFLPLTRPLEIRPGCVVLERIEDGGRFEHPADFVLLNTGFVADMSLFEQAGVNLVGEDRAPEYNPDTMETNVPGLFVAGTAAAGTQSRYHLFIENTHIHVGRIFKALTGRWPEQLGTIPSRSYELPAEQIEAN